MAPPVVRFALLYGAGLWAGLVVLAPHATLWSAGAVTVGGIAARRWAGVLAAVFAVGLAAGGVRARADRASCAAVWEPGPVAAILSIHDASGIRGLTRASVEHAVQGCGGTLRLRVPGPPLPAGRRVIAVGRYRPGAFTVDHARVLAGRPRFRFALRDRVARRLARLYGARTGVVEALVLGRRDDLPPALRGRFVQAGLAHLLAISGLHVGIIAAWLLLLGRPLVGRRRAWAFAVVATWAYVAFLGFPAPATRAAGFVTIRAVAALRQRHPPVGAVLAVAILVVLAVDPASVTAVGAWLSAAAVWGTAWGTGLLPERVHRLPMVRLAAASFGAVLATAPITAFSFGTVSPAGLVTNLVAVPLAGVVVPGVFGSLVVGSLLAGGAGVGLAALERVAEWGGVLPGGHLVGIAGWGFAWPWALLLAAAVWVERVRPTRRMAIRLILAAAGSWALVGVVGRFPRGSDGRLGLYVLDVGQGDAIAIRTPRDRWILVDAGPRGVTGDAGRRVVVPFLRRHRVSALTALIVTHGDADHVGGAVYATRELAPGLVLEPGQPVGSRLYLEFLGAVEAGGLDWRAARAGDTLTVDGITLAVLHPSAAWMAGELSPNENSVVLRVSYGCFDALLTGDIGAPAERLLLGDGVEADLLKVGHHGSAGGTTAEWLDAVRPKAAVVSVGRHNRYGHPAPSVVERLAARKIPVWRTDSSGTVTITTDGRYLSLNLDRNRTLGDWIRCSILRSLPSNDSSSSRRSCIRRPPVSLPACSTTSPLPRR